MFYIKRTNNSVEILDPELVPALISSVLQENQTSFTVEKTPREYLSVVFTDRGCGIIYIRHDPTYIALDASTEPNISNKRVTLMVDGEPTCVPKNMKLTKRKTLDIIKEFCRSGKLLETVHWIREELAPAARDSRKENIT